MVTGEARYAGFALRTECPHCGMPLPLDRPTLQAFCSQCQNEVAISDSLWKAALGLAEGARAPAPGSIQSKTLTVAGRPVTVDLAMLTPVCDRCSASFDLDLLPRGEATDLACPECGHLSGVEPAPAWLRGVMPTAVQIIGVEPRSSAPTDGLTAQVSQETPQPVVMSCPKCGASLSVTGEQARIMSCRYCGSEVFLPDAIWRRLHPIKTVRWFYVRFEGLTPEQRAELELQQRMQAQIEEERAAYEVWQRREAEREVQERERASWERERQRRLEAEARSAVRSAWIAVALIASLSLAMSLVGILGDLGRTAAVVLLAAVAVADSALTALASRPWSIITSRSRGRWTAIVTLLSLIAFAPLAGTLLALLALLALPLLGLWKLLSGAPVPTVTRPFIAAVVVDLLAAVVVPAALLAKLFVRSMAAW